MKAFSLVCVLALVAGAHAGIYPDDHWDYSTKLTVDSFDAHVKEQVDAGKTLFVRWIASEGWGWWRKQAPGWNEMVKLFGSNNDVSFGDVNLSSDSVRSSHGTPQSPGAGGWPTVRYFNEATGYGGAPYAKRTADPMCTELGPGKPYLREYIETAGTTALCSVATSDGCSDRQRTYVEKMKAKGGDEVAKQLARLGKMAAGENKMKPELKLWLAQRIGILRQLGPKDEL